MLKNLVHLLTALGLLMFVGSVSAAPHKVRVNDPAVAKSLVAQGGKLVADYGTFQIVEADDATLAGQDASKTELKDEYDFIQLNAKRLDTRTAEVNALRKSVGAFTGKQLHLVQFAGPVKPEWRAELEASGVRIVSYIPNNAYLVYGDSTALGSMQTWAATKDFVQWDGDYADDYKIHPRARVTDEKGNPRNPGTDLFAVQLLGDSNVNSATLALIDGMKLEPVRNQYRTLDYLNVIVRLPAARLKEIAARPEVISIAPYFEPKKLDERQDQILAGNLSGSSPSSAGYLAWLASKGFTQAQFTNSGFIVDVSDSGIDNGTTTPGHFGLYRLGSTSQVSRVVYARLVGTANSGSTLQGCDGHGTINSHIIGGYDNQTNLLVHTDASNFSYGLGVCPFVKVGSSVIFDPDNWTSPNYTNLQYQAYTNGARISNNSWGAAVSGAYNADAQAYDVLVRNVGGASTNRPMVIVFAAGNEGSSSQTIDAPGSAKNVITVGAAENVRSLSTDNGGNSSAGSDGCGEPDSDADNADDIASFSSRGPCSDGRMKPDIVAPGTHITGGVAQTSPAPSPSGTGSAISCFDGTGVCGLPGGGTTGSTDNFFPLGQQFYTVSSGTSHSTPAVAGACALVRQYFINRSLAAPSPAMTKAFLMNSARYLTGNSANDTLWSANQGMGEVNLGLAFDGTARVLRDQLSADKFTATAQTRTFTGTIADPAKPFRVTLAWTDAPGSTAASSALDNDLDLTVTVDGVTYKGNVFSGAYSTTGGTADSKNNVESVFLPAGVSGSFIVTVTAANINSDGVPNESPTQDQDFALVVYNAITSSVPVVVVSNYTVVGEGCTPTNGVIDPGETVTVNFGLKNVGSANTTNLVVTLLATNGITSPSGSQTYGALVAGGATVSKSFSFTADGTCGGSITAMFQLKDGSADLGMVSQTITLGVITLTTLAFTNATSISIPASGTIGNASPYPSTITVSGITNTVSKVTVTLRALTHTYPDDIDVLLVGPAGQNVIPMSDCGGGYDVSGVTLTFDDNASSSLPDASQIVSGTYKPSNYGTTADTFSSPAPSSPYGSAMSVFNGQNANGTWSLYIVDDASSDSGSLAQGWTLSITTSYSTCCSNAVSVSDLAIGQSVSASRVNIGSNITYSIVVTNLGPASASSVVVTDTLPAGISFVSASSSQGTYTNAAGVFTCALGTMANGATATINIQTTAATAGSWTNTATVSTGSLDSTSSNNSASVSISVNSSPTISNISDVTINENGVAGPIAFTIGDAETSASALTLTKTSSNTNLVPVANIVFGGSDSNRTVTITPSTNQFGASTIGITVSDGMAGASDSFLLTVNQFVPSPTIESILLTNQTVVVEWLAATGRTYRVQFKGDLLQTNWDVLTPDVVATGSLAAATNVISATTNRFYRIVLLP